MGKVQQQSTILNLVTQDNEHLISLLRGEAKRDNLIIDWVWRYVKSSGNTPEEKNQCWNSISKSISAKIYYSSLDRIHAAELFAK